MHLSLTMTNFEVKSHSTMFIYRYIAEFMKL